MAGPGGGPPRKSHTKSRKGCKTCKKRHIRCDENFPQCRNCTKHSCRCDYMDQPPLAEEAPKSPRGLNLLFPPSIDAEIDNWMRSGIYPFPELALSNHMQFRNLQKIDLRLVHHVSQLYKDLQRMGVVHCTAWVEKLPVFLDIASGHDFVMSAILAFSATNLASETNSAEVRNLGYHHQGVALNGLHNAIGNFSQGNSDPILAASILLSWQASDWNGWSSLMQGITTVLSSMGPWKDTSTLALFVEQHVQPQEQDPFFMPPSLGGMMAPVLPEDDHSLQEAIAALQHLLAYLRHNVGLHQYVEELLLFAQEIEMCSRTMRGEQIFEKLQRLRSRLLWSPISLLKTQDRTSMNFVTIAHLYALAMAVDASLPELNGASFGALAAAPMDDVERRVRFSSPQSFDSSSAMDELMIFPCQIANKTRQARGIFDQLSQQESLNPGQQSPYGFQNLNIESGPTTPNFPPTFPIFAANISAEYLTLSVPPSPFLHSFVPQATSRRHSALVESRSPRPSSMNFSDRRSFSGFSSLGHGGESPAYSPAAYSPAAYSPVPSNYLEDDHSLFGESTSSWMNPSGNFLYDESPDKGKARRSS